MALFVASLSEEQRVAFNALRFPSAGANTGPEPAEPAFTTPNAARPIVFKDTTWYEVGAARATDIRAHQD